MNEAQVITEHNAVLGDSARKPGGNAYRTLNTQAREIVIMAHFSFSNPNVRPPKWSNCLRAGSRPDIPDPCFIEPCVTESVRMSERENGEVGISGTGKTRNVARWIKTIAGKGHDLTVMFGEK